MTVISYRVSSLLPSQTMICSIQAAVDATSRHSGMTTDELLRRTRRLPLAHWRQVAMYVARRATSAGLPELGDFFDRDHTTILHGIRETQREIDLGVRETIQTVEDIIGRLEMGATE